VQQKAESLYSNVRAFLFEPSFKFSCIFRTQLTPLIMKKSILIAFLFFSLFSGYGQDNVSISFSNDTKETFHLSLIIYTPDGKIQTRVSDLASKEIKSYSLPINTAIYIADLEQEAFAMKGNDIKASGAKPYIVLKDSYNKRIIVVSSIGKSKTPTF
jgi:hypothetical protein